MHGSDGIYRSLALDCRRTRGLVFVRSRGDARLDGREGTLMAFIWNFLIIVAIVFAALELDSFIGITGGFGVMPSQS